MPYREGGELIVGDEEELHVGCGDLEPALRREPLRDIAAAGKPLQMIPGRPVTPRVPDDAVHAYRSVQVGRATRGRGGGHTSMFTGQAVEFLR